MASISFEYNTAILTTLGRGLVDMYKRVSRAIVSYGQRVESERYLETLDDRLLRDIGIERGDIHSLVWQGRK